MFTRLPNIPYHNLFWVFLAGIIFIVAAFYNYDLEAKNEAEIENGIFRSYDEAGTLRMKIPMSDGERHGLAKAYNENGQLKSEMTYKEGYRNGIARKYYTTGDLYIESMYAKDKLNGVRKRYYRDGQLMSIQSYKDDLPGTDLIEYGRSKCIRDFSQLSVSLDTVNDSFILNLEPLCHRQRFYIGRLTEDGFFDRRRIVSRLIRTPENKYRIPRCELANLRYLGKKLICTCTTNMGNQWIASYDLDSIFCDQ